MHRHLHALALPIALLVAAVSLHAQGAARKKLQAAKGLSCSFTTMATGTWAADGAHAEVKPSKLALRFTSIDESSAQVAGFLGPSYAIVRLTEGSLHIMTVDNAGPLYVTTVFDKLTADGKFYAVHTRHEFTEVSLPGFTSRPEQYYGSCEIDQ